MSGLFSGLFGFVVDFTSDFYQFTSIIPRFFSWFTPDRFSYFGPLVTGAVSAMVVLALKRVIL